MEEKEKSKLKFGDKIAIVFVCFLLFIGFGIWYPSWKGSIPKRICSRAETDAHKIAEAISDFYSVPEHNHPTPTQSDIERFLDIKNPWKLTTCGDNFYIHVIDRTGKCPAEYQNTDPNWNSNIYTRKF